MSADRIRALKDAAREKKGQPPTKKKYRIRPRTKKKAMEYRELRSMYEPFLEEHKLCEIRSPVCTGKATCVHHVAGRGKRVVLDPKYHKASCWPCNDYVESHHQWAVDNGHKISRHAKRDQ